MVFTLKFRKAHNKPPLDLACRKVSMTDAQNASGKGWFNRYPESERPSLFVRGRISESASIVLALAALMVPLVILFASSAHSGAWLLILCGACLLFSFTFAGAASYYYRRWDKWQERQKVEDELKKDPRPPILYLRPFTADVVRFATWDQRIRFIFKCLYSILLFAKIVRDIFRRVGVSFPDTRRLSAEEFLVSLLDPLGPVIAIGRPKDKIPPLGAVRIYLTDKGENWKDVVSKKMKEAQLILMFAGTTEHFVWELESVFKNEPFVASVLILPFFRRYRRSEVDRFRSLFQDTTGLRLSSDLRRTRAVFFPNASEVIEICDSNTDDERALNELNPFLGPIAQIMERSRPGWAEGYIEAARANRRSNRLWIAAGVTALLLVTGGSFEGVRWNHQKERDRQAKEMKDKPRIERAESFFQGLADGKQPCYFSDLAKFIPSPASCYDATQLCYYSPYKDICIDPSVSELFPDSQICEDAAARHYPKCPPRIK